MRLYMSENSVLGKICAEMSKDDNFADDKIDDVKVTPAVDPLALHDVPDGTHPALLALALQVVANVKIADITGRYITIVPGLVFCTLEGVWRGHHIGRVVNEKEGIYYNFDTGRCGDVIRLLMETTGKSFGEVVIFLATRLPEGNALPSEQVIPLLMETTGKSFKEAVIYLAAMLSPKDHKNMNLPSVQEESGTPEDTSLDTPSVRSAKNEMKAVIDALGLSSSDKADFIVQRLAQIQTSFRYGHVSEALFGSHAVLLESLSDGSELPILAALQFYEKCEHAHDAKYRNFSGWVSYFTSLKVCIQTETSISITDFGREYLEHLPDWYRLTAARLRGDDDDKVDDDGDIPF